jgi:hypothetical protein
VFRPGPACRPLGTDATTRTGPGPGPSLPGRGRRADLGGPSSGGTADETPEHRRNLLDKTAPASGRGARGSGRRRSGCGIRQGTRPAAETGYPQDAITPLEAHSLRGLAPIRTAGDSADKAGPGARPLRDPERRGPSARGAEDHVRDRVNPRGSPTHWRRSATSRAAPGGRTRPGCATPKRSGSWPGSAHRKRHGTASARPIQASLTPGQPCQAASRQGDALFFLRFHAVGGKPEARYA